MTQRKCSRADGLSRPPAPARAQPFCGGLMAAVENLVDTLALERIEVNLFRGHAPQNWGPRIFGGLVIGQALLAAYRTVETRHCHSLHCYFIRPGDPAVPILYDVDRSRDGRSFTTRRVTAIQHGLHQIIPTSSPPPSRTPRRASSTRTRCRTCRRRKACRPSRSGETGPGRSTSGPSNRAGRVRRQARPPSRTSGCALWRR